MDIHRKGRGIVGNFGAAVAAFAFLVACSKPGEVIGPPSGTTGGTTGDNTGGNTGGTTASTEANASGGTFGVTITLPTAAGGVGGTSEPGTEPTTPWPPPGYVNVTDATTGAYALGPKLGTENSPSTKCTGLLFGVVRDFKMGDRDGGHPDFETAPTGLDRGMVQSTLDSDGKPVYARPDGKTSSTTGKANFDQWYRDVADVNMPYILGLKMVDVAGTSTFSALKPAYFFPLDGQGFGNQDESHNFSFTTELHTSFVYKGGETFTFIGDDDVWVFIDKKLVIDLGGRHAQSTGTVKVDSLGLAAGNTYELAVFHAERHTNESNFQIQTTLAFTDCGQVNGVIY